MKRGWRISSRMVIISTHISSYFSFCQNKITVWIYWNITPCNPVVVNRRFGVKYRLQLQGCRVRQAIPAEAGMYFFIVTVVKNSNLFFLLEIINILTLCAVRRIYYLSLQHGSTPSWWRQQEHVPVYNVPWAYSCNRFLTSFQWSAYVSLRVVYMFSHQAALQYP
jgi:hypothetical protein